VVSGFFLSNASPIKDGTLLPGKDAQPPLFHQIVEAAKRSADDSMRAYKFSTGDGNLGCAAAEQSSPKLRLANGPAAFYS
jgi:hypothetical protein